MYAESSVMRFPRDTILAEKRLDPEGQDTTLGSTEADEPEDTHPFFTPLVAAGEAMVSSDED